MDKIYLKNVEIFANHGVFKEEKTLGQKFVLDLELTLSLEEAGRTGDLTKSVHYGELCHGIEKEFMKESYDLIETAAQKVAEFTLYNYPLVKDVKVTLKKPWAPIGRHLDYAAVQIERGLHEAYLSIGSNIGNKEENLNRAIELINSKYYLTGSNPPLLKGLHLKIRQRAIIPPLTTPYLSIASKAYWEQVGIYLHFGGLIGEMFLL